MKPINKRNSSTANTIQAFAASNCICDCFCSCNCGLFGWGTSSNNYSTNSALHTSVEAMALDS